MKISENLREPSLAPRKDDVLFGPSSRDWVTNACVNNRSWQPDLSYSLGYREGALQLASHVLKTHRDQDTLIFPISFLYRHHLELVLKRIIRVTSAVSQIELTKNQAKKLLKEHNLKRLWSDAKERLFSSYEVARLVSPENADIKGIDSYIDQVNKIDPNSQASRYPVSNKGEPHLEGITHINIRALAENMERLCDYLEGIEFGLDMYLDHQAEMRASAW